MSIDQWSADILVIELQDDPGFTDDLNSLTERLTANGNVDIVFNFAGVKYINSSNIARLLKVRKLVTNQRRRLVLCEINTNVWGLFLVTGLDKVFQFTDKLATALASVQIAAE